MRSLLNIFLWTLQGLLAIHTLMGAVWKFSNTEQAVSSLTMLPHEVWLGLSAVEILASLGLILPAFSKKLALTSPLSAAFVTVEMLFFSVVHLSSGETNHSPVIYWSVVAVISGFVAYGRYVLKPHARR